MLGEFIIKILVLVFGYLYPAFECFRTMEQREVNPMHLRFWCQYWVIMAVLIAIEKFGDIFVSWLPLYGEVKLAFIIYLWHPKTKGTSYVYDRFLRPFIVDHESDIEVRMKQIMEKSGDLLTFYFQNFVDKGQSLAFEILQYILSRTGRTSPFTNESARRPPVPPPSEEQRYRRPSSSSPPVPLPSEEQRNRRRPSSSPPPVSPPSEEQRNRTWPSPSHPPSSFTPSAPPLEQQPPRGTSTAYPAPTVIYPSVNSDDDLQPEVNRVEEALRAAGVNLPGLRRRS